MRRGAAALLVALVALAGASGCSRIPRIIVLADPLTAAEHVQLGVGYERNGELDLAEREYGRALRKDAGCFQAVVNLGNVSLARGDHEKARKRYLEALGLRPGDPEATNNLAMAAIRSGDAKRMEDARVRMEAVLADPGRRLPELSGTMRELDAAMARANAQPQAPLVR